MDYETKPETRILQKRKNSLRAEPCHLSGTQQSAGPADHVLTNGTDGQQFGNRNGAADDMRLVARVRAGDQQALSELYDRYSKVVYGVALRILHDTGAAEDLLQDIFLQLWRKPDAFDSSRGSLAAWLAVIARHRSIDRLRQRRPETDIEDCVIVSATDLRDETERSLVIEKVRVVMNEMSPDQRTAMEMAFFEGLTHTEIAEKTGEPLGTIKTRIRSGLQMLRARFAS